MRTKINVYIIKINYSELINSEALKSVCEFIQTCSESYDSKRIRVYTTDHVISYELKKNGIDVPWCRTLLTEKEDSLLFKRTGEIFSSWQEVCDKFFCLKIQDQSIARGTRDDMIRKLRNFLSVDFLCQKDFNHGTADAHIVLTMFPFLTFYSSEFACFRVNKSLFPRTKRDMFDYLRYSLYRLSYFTFKKLPLFRRLFIFSDIFKATPFVSSQQQSIKNEKEPERLLFSVAEVIGGKNVLDPLIYTLNSINDDIDYRILVDNHYSQEYLSQHGYEANLIHSEKSCKGIKLYIMSFLMRSVAMDFAMRARYNVNAMLYLAIASTDFLPILQDILYRIEFCDKFIRQYKPSAALIYPEEAYSCLASIYACKRHGIPTMHIPDRFRQANPVNPDRLFWTNSDT
ncbi:MAG: hypothetical protein GX434_08525 [Peptococcaceae bacterium]|nr:hypothetical protein [Peptococcaceae bacterium]